MKLSTHDCRRLFLILILMCSFEFSNKAQAGTIGFSISFTGDEITITNTGSEAAYALSEWTLDQQAHWQKAHILQGNPAYVAPGKKLIARRQSQAASTGLGKADPLLLVLHDQAGSRITQLAWRQTPAYVTKGA